MTCRKTGQSELALKYYQKAKFALKVSKAQINKSSELKKLEARILNNIGLACYYHESFKNSKKLLKRARKCHNEARRIYNELGDFVAEAEQLYNLSLLHHPQYAKQLLEKAICIWEKEAPLFHRLKEAKVLYKPITYFPNSLFNIIFPLSLSGFSSSDFL